MHRERLAKIALCFAILSIAGCGAGTSTGLGGGNPPAGSQTTASPAGGSGSASAAPVGGASAAPGQTASPAPIPGATQPPATATSATQIKHIVILIQENRTFDDLFHGFSEPSGAQADYASYGYDKAGDKIALVPQLLEQPSVLDNGHAAFVDDYDGGKMDGFYDHNALVSGVPASANGNNGMSYVPQVEVQPYWDLATQGALAERFFHGVTGATWPSHLVFAAGSSTWNGDPNQRFTENPTSAGCSNGTGVGNTEGTLNADGTQGPVVDTCIKGVSTIADLLVAAGHTWHWYSAAVVPSVANTAVGVASPTGILNSLQSYDQDYFASNWTSNAIAPETRILVDVPLGTLADVTWVTPDGANTDHPGVATSGGPAWVSSVVNTIGQSKFWSSTAVFVTWDDWGGFYDHVPPPQKYGVYGPGFRIPLIAISPYAKHGQLIDTQLEPGSLIKFIEETFGLPSLGREDATSNSASAMFDFTQTPAAYKVVTAAKMRSYFLRQKPCQCPLDTDEYGPGHP
jgi:phospholipase C